MSALLNGIHDRSSVVQKAFAFALGHLVRVGTGYDEHAATTQVMLNKYMMMIMMIIFRALFKSKIEMRSYKYIKYMHYLMFSFQ